jgi:hypothetical protein
MRTGEIATRVDKAVQQAGPSRDIRTSDGAGVLTSIINQQGDAQPAAGHPQRAEIYSGDWSKSQLTA